MILSMINQQQCENGLKAWISAVEQGDVIKVLQRYHPEATLVPTLSNIIRQGHAALKDYFDNFLAKQPRCKINQTFFTALPGKNSGVLAGTYTFTFADQSSALARFNYVFSIDGEQILIHSHHSSVMPEA